MKVIYGLGKAVTARSNAIAIGIFDGVHNGHQQLIHLMLTEAKRLKAESTVITFYPHPAHVLRPEGKLPYISSLDERLKMFKLLGVKQCIVVKFNASFANISPEYFIQHYLVKRLKAQSIIVGEDFRFGRDRKGDIFLFEQLAQKLQYHFKALKPVTYKGAPISSTRIRGAVMEGNLTLAQHLLGRPFSLEGRVIKGDQRGRLLGFPTANVDYTANVIPPKGVYAVRVNIEQVSLRPGSASSRKKSLSMKAVANLGVRPTFTSIKEGLHLEVHVMDEKKNFYNKIMRVEFVKKIRDEKVFPSVDLLKRQIARDIASAHQALR